MHGQYSPAFSASRRTASKISCFSSLREASTGSNRNCPLSSHSVRLAALTPPVGMKSACGRGPLKALTAFGPKVSPGKQLDHICPIAQTFQHILYIGSPRKTGHTIAVAQLHDLCIQMRTDHKLLRPQKLPCVQIRYPDRYLLR